MACSAANRKAKESPLSQGEDERIAYQITTTPWGSSPSSVTVTVKHEASEENVTADVTTGSASVAGDVITLPVIHSLRANHSYRVEVKFTAGGNVYEPFFIIEAST